MKRTVFLSTTSGRNLLALFVAIVFLLQPVIAFAQSRPSLVRDAEIEALIADMAAPLMKAAGLRRGSVDFFLVNDPSFNAFVSGRGMFINTGLLLQANDPGEIIGVMAHELGHLVGAHQVKLRQRMDEAARIARITSLLGLGIGIAGAASGSSDAARGGLALASGGRSFAMRDLLKYKREEEAAADQTAVQLLRKTGQSGKGMMATFRRLAQQVSIIGGRIDPYLQSHPLPNERLAALREKVRSSPSYNKPVPNRLKQRHDMARAKIAAYSGDSRYARSLLSGKELSADAKTYGTAIVAFLYGSPKKAIGPINRLLKRQPKNPYIYEMKGEIMLRTGNASAAIAPFRRAVLLDRTGAGFLRIELGHALLESGKPSNVRPAIEELNKGLARDRNSVNGYRLLAIGYGRINDTPRALLASAEAAIRTGKKDLARDYAKRAQASFKHGSPGWLRAQDILTYK